MIINKYFIILFLGTILQSCDSNDNQKRVEEIYQNCLYDSLSDNGEKLKQYIKGFEEHLVDQKILKDSTPQSYYTLFKSISEGKEYNSYYEYSYIDSINKIERYKINPYNEECLIKINSLRKFDESKMARIHKEVIPFMKEKGEYKFSEIISKILPHMEVKDFELDYYKHKTFMFLYFSDDVLNYE